MNIEAARRIADTVLYEGYILYPYRASHGKNASGVRWQFGVLVPRRHADANPLPPGAMQAGGTVSGAVETWCQQTECIVEAADDASVDIRLRFLHLQARLVEQAGEGGTFIPVESLSANGELYVTWDEGVETEHDVTYRLADLCAGEQVVPIELAGSQEVERPRRLRRHGPRSGDPPPPAALPPPARVGRGAARPLRDRPAPGPDRERHRLGRRQLRHPRRRRAAQPGRHPPDPGRHGWVKVRIAARPAGMGQAGAGVVLQPVDLARARRRRGQHRHDAVVADGPPRPSADRAREPHGPLRRHRE